MTAWTVELPDTLEPVPEKCGRFSDQDRLTIKGLEHFR